MLLAILLALAPALIAWWTGRGILARADDPALPEILFERRRRLGQITLAGAVALAVLDGASLYWTLPLLWFTLLVSGYPLRRSLFGERWGLLGFLRYAIVSGIGAAGWRLLVVIGPLVTVTCALGVDPEAGDAARRVALWVGGAFMIVTLLWQQFYAQVWLDLHHATPLRESAPRELVARLDTVLDRAKLGRRPRVYRYGAPGGHLVNALAIPSLRAPAIALSDDLLATLTDDEIVGVFAHEVAHHEQFTRRRLLVAATAGAVLTVLGFALVIGFLANGPASATVAAAVSCVALVIALRKRPASRRSAETASDLRAGALTGDPESLATALTKMHLSNRVPRRWSHAMESAATHPSVARRIQALRATAAPAAPIVTSPAPLAIAPAARGDTVVMLEMSRAHWFHGVPAGTPHELDALRRAASTYRAVSYSDLVELRIAPAGDERTLNAVDRHGHAWSVPVAPSDVPILQAALDTVDVRLGPRPAVLQPAGMATARLLAIAALLTLAVSGEAGVVLVPILVVLFRPALTAAVAATGAIALARALVATTSFAWVETARQTSVVGALAVALALIVVAIRRARDEQRRDPLRRPPREAWLLVLLLGCLTFLFVMGALPLTLARAASLVSSPLAISAATTLAGMGAAIATMSRPWSRIGGGLTSVAAVGGAVLLAGNGSLYHRTAALSWSTGRLEPAGVVPILGAGVTTLDASPHGSRYAVAQYRVARRGTPGIRYLVGRFGNAAPAPRASDALQLAFLDDQTVLVLALRGDDSLELRAESVDIESSGNARVLWRRAVPATETPRLLLDRARRLWIVLGRGDGDQEVVVTSGAFDGGPSHSQRWRGAGPQDVGEIMAQPLAAFADGTAIWSTLGGLRDAGTSFGPMLMLATANPQWELRSAGPSGDHVLADVDGVPMCGIDIDSQGAVCIERAATRTRIWRIRPSGAAPAADLPRSFDAIHPLASGRVAAVERFGSQLAVVDLTTHRAVRFGLPDDPGRAERIRWTSDVVAGGEYVLVLSSSRAGASIRRYRIVP